MRTAGVLLVWLVCGVAARAADDIPVPVLTVCEALKSRDGLQNRTVILVGRLAFSEEGAWLLEECTDKIVTDGHEWWNSISLSYIETPAPAPKLPEGFRWDEQELSAKLEIVRKTTGLKQEGDEWMAIFGRFETRVPLRVVRSVKNGRELAFAYGFGHLNQSPAQLVAVRDSYHPVQLRNQ